MVNDAEQPEALVATEEPAARQDDESKEALRLAPENRVKGERPSPSGFTRITPSEKDLGDPPQRQESEPPKPPVDNGGGRGNGGGGGGDEVFHKRLGPMDFAGSLKRGLRAVRRNMLLVMLFTCATNLLILAIPVYLFQISDRVLTSRSMDTLIMLTTIIVGAVVLQAILDAVRRFILMRTAVELAAQLGSPILSAAARASLNGNGREYQTLGDLQQLRSFLVSGTLLSFLDVPFAPLFILAIYLVHPHLGMIVVATALVLLVIAIVNQRVTSGKFAEANLHLSKANLHLDSMSRNSQIINALAMIPEAVSIWGRDTAASLKAQVRAQDRNIISAACSRAVRLLTQIGLLGWGAYLAIQGHITGGMVIAASIIAGRALAPIEGAIEGWNHFLMSRSAYDRIAHLLRSSPLNQDRLILPRPEGRLDVERLLYVPQGTKNVVLNGLSFVLAPGESLAIVGNSGAGKTTLGKMLVGSVLPTSGAVRLDLMDLRNWDQRQLGTNIGYLPQDVQLFPGTIKQNIARMREDATDAQIHEAAMLADVHGMISNFPQGYETFVAADGAPLSGGQKQRIALARAFFGNPRLVVLDEPNSNLDTAGDQALARAVADAKSRGMTLVVITQKPSLLSSVDKIMLMADGNIALYGQRQQVLEALEKRRRGNGGGGQQLNSPNNPNPQAG
ncbi:type I secretion system permease/ATPase [Vannielia litorea]|uniref:ATP-binding cassette, subfamily C n=1 Tax=Vannielia litorea TaxID=1217970 RepID=A0A1N6E627_9RHOB|nr:type I secretion system permease/ATPase [Vannielia litorea]SIN78478.1 ATP-binding cassette, subfamily C [Vannielia litorea]